MLLLVHKALKTLEKHRHPHLGTLISPRGGGAFHLLPEWEWAADNDAFAAWDEKRFLRMLDNLSDIPGCRFVSCPDVVADADRTHERYEQYKHEITDRGMPVAIVAQDGLSGPLDPRIPWDEIDAIFIGGSTEFKLGMEAAQIVGYAKQLGKWAHMGRVNSFRRIRYAHSIGCDSVDGTNYSMFTDKNLPPALALLEQLGGRQTEGVGVNQVQTTIISVNPRNTARGQVWDVVDGQGVKYTAWEPAQAQKAMALLNQTVLLTYLEKPSSNPQYGPNRSFKDAMPFTAQPGAAPIPQPVQVAPPALPLAPATEGPAIRPSDRDAQIVRQSAYKAAVDLAGHVLCHGSLSENDAMQYVRRITDELVAYGLTGNWGGGAVAAEPAPVPAAADAAPWE